MKLYYSPGASSLSPHIALRECGARFELVRVDLKTHTLEDGRDYRAVNPKGYVPALEPDDGQLLTEGPAILQYVAELHPAAGLVPAAGTLERARLQEWLNFTATELHRSFSPLFRRVSADWKEAALANLQRRLDLVAEHLAARPYLLGDRFSVADAYLFTTLSWARFVQLDLSAWPALQAYAERVAARPKVQEALRAEGLLG